MIHIPLPSTDKATQGLIQVHPTIFSMMNEQIPLLSSSVNMLRIKEATQNGNELDLVFTQIIQSLKLLQRVLTTRLKIERHVFTTNSRLQ